MTEVSSSPLDLHALQKQIEERIQHWYVHQLGHSKVNVACHIFDNKLMIVLDEAITQPERLLVASGRLDFAQQMRNALEQIFRLYIQQTIESLTRAHVVDLLTATQLDTERTSVVVILSEPIAAENLVANLPYEDGQANERGG